jgi:hypothetical protein
MRKTIEPALTEAAIFADLWDRSPNRMTPAVARYILKLSFTEEERTRVVELVRRNTAGRLSVAEVEEMDTYLRAGDLLALLQSKARRFLKEAGSRRNGHG